jgi:hypothetical protein
MVGPSRQFEKSRNGVLPQRDSVRSTIFEISIVASDTMDEVVVYDEVRIGSERGFGLVLGVAFALVGLHPLIGDGGVRRWALATAAAFLLLGLVVPRTLAIPNRLWFWLGMFLGSVIAQLAMAVVFYLVMTPTGVLLRLFRKSSSSYSMGSDSSAETYWIARGPDANPMGSLRNQY